MASKPKLTQVAVTCSAGGKVQIIKYDVDSSYFVSASQTFSIPDDMSDAEAEQFQFEALAALREAVDERAQGEFEERWDQSYLS